GGNGVAWTARSGGDGSTRGSPAYGSRYAPRTAPLAFSTFSARAATRSSSRVSSASRASGPRGSAGPRFRRVVFFGGRGAAPPARFFAGLMIPLLLRRLARWGAAMAP